MDARKLRFLYGYNNGVADAAAWKGRLEQCVADALIKRLDKAKSSGIYPHLREYFLEEDWRRIEAMQGFSKARLELLFRVTMDNGKRAIAMKKKRRMQRERKNGDQATFVEVESPEDNDKPETIDFVPDIEDLSNFIVYEVVDCTSTGENEDHVEVQTSFVDEN